MSCAPLKLEDVAAPEADEQYCSTDFDWAKVAGVRYKRMRDMLQSEYCRLTVTVFDVVFEPLRILCSYFLYISWWTDRTKAPPLFDVLWSPMSIVHHVQQHYSSMLRGSAGRLHIFRGLFPVPDKEQWRFMRRALHAATGAVFRRHVRYFHQFRFFCIGDVRRAAAERLEFCRTLCQMDSCCLRPGFWKRLASKLRAMELPMLEMCNTLLSWGCCFVNVAWMLKLSIADVERCHAKNGRRTHPQSLFDLLCARIVNGELRNRLDARLRLAEQQLQLKTVQDGPAVALQEICLIPKRKRSALQLFHADQCRQSKAQGAIEGVKTKVTTAEFWQKTFEEFEQLPEDELACL